MTEKTLWGALAVGLALASLGGCLAGEGDCVTKTGNPSCGGGEAIGAMVDELAQQCGVDVACDGNYLAEGNASVSGVASVDGFFRTVLDFEARVDGVRRQLDGELEAIRRAFDVAPDANLLAAMQARLQADLDGDPRLIAQAPRCAVDTQVLIEASARCDAEAQVGASVQCRGSCELGATLDADCDEGGQLSCTFPSNDAPCEGSCSGRCVTELSPPAPCGGTCRGTCDGTCDRVDGDDPTRCAGACDGACDGTCELPLAAGTCEGRCDGECTRAVDNGGCEGALGARCEATGQGVVACDGRCEGEVLPPAGPAECEASAAARAKMQLRCTPPEVRLDYRPRADLDPADAAELRAAMRTLELHLPALLAELARARALVDAGDALVEDAEGRVGAAFAATADAAGEGNLRVLFGLQCAVTQARGVPAFLQPAIMEMSATLTEGLELASALGAPR